MKLDKKSPDVETGVTIGDTTNVPRYITICIAKCRKRTDWLPGIRLKNMREFTDRHFMMPQKRLILTGKIGKPIKDGALDSVTRELAESGKSPAQATLDTKI